MRTVESRGNWERLAEQSPDWLREYGPTAGLERWERADERRFEADAKQRVRPVGQTLDVDRIGGMLRPLMGSCLGVVERELVFAVALSIWGDEHVQQELDRAKAYREGSPPFKTIDVALLFYLTGETGVGLTPTRTLKSDTDSPFASWTGAASRFERASEHAEERSAKARAEARGHVHKHAISHQSAHVKGIGVVDLKADVAVAIRESGIGPVELWLIEATSFGTTVGLTMCGTACEATNDRATCAARGSSSAIPSDGRVTSVSGVCEHACDSHFKKCNRNSVVGCDTGRVGNRAINANLTGITLLKWDKEKGGGAGRRERMRRADAAEAFRRMAGLTVDDEGASDEAIGKRITRARKAVEDALLARGLVEPPREKADKAGANGSPRRKRDAMPRVKPEPIRPRFASEAM